MTERFAYVNAVEEQNTKLRKIARIQSHVVRAPLARIMGIEPMIKDIDNYIEERQTMLEYLLIAAHELDHAIQNISNKTSKTVPGIPYDESL